MNPENTNHTHNGIDSPTLNLSDSYLEITDTIPTNNAKEGTTIIYSSGATRRIYVMIGGTWRYTNLT